MTQGDEIRRLITESLLPYLTEKGHVWKVKREYAKSKKDADEKGFIPSQVRNVNLLFHTVKTCQSRSSVKVLAKILKKLITVIRF